MDLKKTESSMNVVTSTHQTESTVINKPVSKVWETLRTCQFDKFFPKSVTCCKFTSGDANSVGSEFQITYKDNSVWTSTITEISENRRRVSWELVIAEPSVTFTSMSNTVSLYKVTSDNTCFIEWSTDFSNDVDSHVVQDRKYKKLDWFNEMKTLFA